MFFFFFISKYIGEKELFAKFLDVLIFLELLTKIQNCIIRPRKVKMRGNNIQISSVQHTNQAVKKKKKSGF